MSDMTIRMSPQARREPVLGCGNLGGSGVWTNRPRVAGTITLSMIRNHLGTAGTSAYPIREGDRETPLAGVLVTELVTAGQIEPLSGARRESDFRGNSTISVLGCLDSNQEQKKASKPSALGGVRRESPRISAVSMASW
jgi:hypothetical protein